MENLTIEMLSEGTDYDFEDFDCGEPSLNAFLAEHLVRQHNGRILRAYLLKERDRPRVLGCKTGIRPLPKRIHRPPSWLSVIWRLRTFSTGM